MKTNRTSTIAALAMALAVSFAASALADGVTASPKLQESLDTYTRNHTTMAAPVGAPCGNCGMCNNQATMRTDYAARGANKPTIAVYSHACKMCDTQMRTVGIGKAAKIVAVHACEHGNCSVASTN